MRARFLVMSFGALAVCLATGPEAMASCGPVCGPCHPHFTFCARLMNQVVKPGAKLPLEILLANHECYWWLYFNSEYGYRLIDDQGHEIPDAIILPTQFRKIWVPPCALLLDGPSVFLNKKLPLGRWYTMIVSLRGHQSSFRFMIGKKSSEASSEYGKQPRSESTAVVSKDSAQKQSSSLNAASSPAAAEARGLIEVSLPADAKVRIHGHLTNSTGPKRVFASPSLLPGMAYAYTVTAEVERQGKVLTQSRSVVIRSGQRTPVRFDFSAAPQEIAEARTKER